MTADLISLVLTGDSHVIGFPEQRVRVDLSNGQPLQPLEMKPVHLGGAWAALDMVVTFPDGRLGLNPKLETALEHWPGMGARGKTPEGGTIARHAVLSLGLGVYHYDPGIEFADRDADRVLFRGDVDFLLPRHPELPADPALTLLPVDLVQDMYEAVLAPMRQALRLIVASNPQRTWVMAAPPPTGDPAILQRLIRNRAKRHGLDPDAIKVPSPLVLLKVWLLLREIVTRICAETACGFIDCADFAAGADGCLKPEYVNDGIHGNGAFRERMTVAMLETVVMAENTLDPI